MEKVGKFFASGLGMFTLFILGAAVMYLIIGGTSSNWTPWKAKA